MAATVSSLDLPTPTQRLRLFHTLQGHAVLWLCACGLCGQPLESERDAYLEWEEHRRVCRLRPRAGGGERGAQG